MSFAHLSVFSEYSIIKGLIKIPDLIDAAVANNMQAVALTDHGNLFAAIKFFKSATKRGIKPIFGCEAWVRLSHDGAISRVFFWCQNYQGYQNLSFLLSTAYLQGMDDEKRAIIDLTKANEKLLEGLFVGLGGSGCLLRNHLDEQANSFVIQQWQSLCPARLVFCVYDFGRAKDKADNAKIMQLSVKHSVPVIAVNEVCFLAKEDFYAHEARLCIERSCVLMDESRDKSFNENQYFRSAEEMQQLFKDWPVVLENTARLVESCNVWFDLSEHFLPNFPIPSEQKLEEYFIRLAKKGLDKRLAETANKDMEKYQQRLMMECEVIISMGFCGYFLIVADFIFWSKQNDISVGPGRGSGAGSLVAYVLGITNIDPLLYGLLFERFLNPERVSMPDFDIDFCMEGRDRVIEYVANKYGKENVSQIITFGTMAARAVVRDVGRVLNHPYGFVDKIAKLVPMDLGMTLTKALEQEPVLAQRYREEADVSELLDLALKLEGVVRGVGKHAGGVVIAPKALYEFSPIYCDSANSSILSQFDKDDIESIGLVKFDFLGLRTLTIIDWAVKLIRAHYPQQKDLDIDQIVLDDAKTFSMLKVCETTAVFQLESRGMKDLIRRLRPDDFEEIVALVALFRPGPLQAGMVDDFIARKHGHSQVSYQHPCLEKILQPTNGVILYQEQVMQIAQVLAGYTLGGADLLRRAMGKKKPEEMAKQRVVFIDGAVENGHKKELASKIFDLIEKFAGYGFNKSHSVAYAMLSYQTAWLKANYPAEFMASALSSDMDNTDKVMNMLQACEAIGLEVLPPDINKSKYKFIVTSAKSLCYGLGAIKGIGEAFANVLVKLRLDAGSYIDLYDVAQRLSKHKLNRKTLECLIKSGALDSIIPDRNAGFCSIDLALSQAEQYNKDLENGQTSLFAQSPANTFANFEYVLVKPWGQIQELREERSVLGLYLSGHPLSSLRRFLRMAKISDIANIKENSKVFVAGLVVGFRVMQGKRGQTMAFATVEDETGSIDVALFGDSYHSFRDCLVKDQIVVIRGASSIDQFSQGLRLQVDWMQLWQDHLCSFAQKCYVYLDSTLISQQVINELQKSIGDFESGESQLVLCCQRQKGIIKIATGSKFSIKVEEDMISALEGLAGVMRVELKFRE